MFLYIVKRILLIIPTFIGITIVIFLVVHLAPGDPIKGMIGELSNKLSPEAYENFKRSYGLDKPILERYLIWFRNFILFDFGNSFQYGKKVSELILERLPVTITINILSQLIILIFGITIGVLAGIHRGKLFDKTSSVVLFGLYSLFEPWVALMLLLILAIWLGIFPIGGFTSINFDEMNFFEKLMDVAYHVTLPVIVLSYAGIAFVAKVVRTSIIEVSNQEYVKFARSLGILERKVRFHYILRNSLIPVITIFSTVLPALIAGSIIIEKIFSLPGIGQLFYNAVFSRDYPIVMGLSAISALLTLVSLLIADILYVIADPRIKFSSQH
ncbi:MAG: ABC transporter permease [Spirochaetia bacterium]|nr:ABC transporter permease [Spirochaetota bacterium]MCX8097325.1 ABC transporter permease [Spirochaetota bacterium]MDW8112826.1 ABC transporter permease [Spirochaetia bacterium]